MPEFLTYLKRCAGQAFIGGRLYFWWMTALMCVSLIGLNAFCRQIAHGLGVTNLCDQVSWGLYIANFGYIEGIGAAAVMLLIPAYLYKVEALERVVIFAELIAVVSIVMCLLFVTVDLGRPDRFWHLIPGLGKFHFPLSMLTWDVVVLNGYLFLMLWITGYTIYCVYKNRKPTPLFYLPVTFISIGWAVSMLAATSFLYVGLGGRPFWNAAIVAARFQASAFAAGPALIILSLEFVRVFTPAGVTLGVNREALNRLRSLIQVSLIINLFLLFCELFKEFYTDSVHTDAARYLLFGLDGHHKLVPWFWSGLTLQICALTLLLLQISKENLGYLNAACVMCATGIWIEKGMGLIVPGFVPTPIGELVEYSPTMTEWLVSWGIWAFGIMLYTVLLKMAVPVLTGMVREGTDKTTAPVDLLM